MENVYKDERPIGLVVSRVNPRTRLFHKARTSVQLGRGQEQFFELRLALLSENNALRCIPGRRDLVEGFGPFAQASPARLSYFVGYFVASCEEILLKREAADTTLSPLPVTGVYRRRSLLVLRRCYDGLGVLHADESTSLVNQCTAVTSRCASRRHLTCSTGSVGLARSLGNTCRR